MFLLGTSNGRSKSLRRLLESVPASFSWFAALTATRTDFISSTLFANSTRGPSARASYSYLSPRGEVAGSRGVEHLASWRTSCIAGSPTPAATASRILEGELEQGAGKGQLRCHGDDATPAGDVGCMQSRADGSVCARGACLCKEPQEGCGFRAHAAEASAKARGRFRAACAVLQAEERGRVESQRLAAARRSE